MKRLAYRIHELFYGELSDSAKKCLKRIAAADRVSLFPKGLSRLNDFH